MKFIIVYGIILLLFILLKIYEKIINKYDRLIEKYLTPNTPTIFKNNIYESPKDLDYFKTQNVIICGLARDISSKIPYLDRNLETITGIFNDHLILAVENDSIDTTREDLKELKNKYNINILGCGIDSSNCVMNTKMYTNHPINKKRIKKMVDLRNVYMDYINNMPDIENYDYVIMLDYDMISGIYTDAMYNTAYYFKNYDDINLIGANSVEIRNTNFLNFNSYKYYDTYALLPKINNEINYKFNSDGSLKDLLEIDSCFGGLAIYRLSPIYGKKYTYEEDKKNHPICEHVVFNRQITGKFINPKFVYPVLEY